MKKTLAILGAAAVLFAPTLAFAAGYVAPSGTIQITGVIGQHAMRVNRTGCANGSACDIYWLGLIAGNKFTYTGSSLSNDGTYTFSSYTNLAGVKTVTVVESFPNTGSEFVPITFSDVAAPAAPALTGFVFLSASSSAASVGLLSGDVSVSLDSAIYLTLIAIAVPLAFYVIQQLLEWFNNPKYKKRR